MKKLSLEGWKKNSKNAKATTESENKRRTAKRMMVKMMLFLGAGAFKPFGVLTLKTCEIEKQFEKKNSMAQEGFLLSD